jgi:predicted ArsR family transcriptional regulator
VVQQWIVTLLKRSGPMTADEMASEMLEIVLSVRPRVCELAAAGVIEETGETRPTASGRPQTVYRVKE